VLDLSIEPDAAGLLCRVQMGTLADVHWHAMHPKGRILNALEFPEPGDARHPHIEVSSDTVAWDQTRGRPFCKKVVDKPHGETRWALLATAHACTNWHVDTNGFGTYIDVEVGGKWWVVAHEKKDGPFFASKEFYNAFDSQEHNLDLWDVHSVYLSPGDRL
jgi:hypothetical protein